MDLPKSGTCRTTKKMVEQERNRSGKLAYRYLHYTAKYRENFDVYTSLRRVYSSLYRNPETDIYIFFFFMGYLF